MGDYLACAYSKRISQYRWEHLFDWDGYNPFWEEGRNCFSDVTLDDYSTSKSIYANGEVWAVTLMEIYDKVGSPVTDKIILSSVYEYANKMEFDLPAKLLLDAEETLYDGLYFKDICTVLADRGFVTKDFCGIGYAEQELKLSYADVLKGRFRQGGELNITLKMDFLVKFLCTLLMEKCL